MIGKPIALIQVPNQRVFSPGACARYLGICTDTLYKITALGQLDAFDFNGRRAYKLEDMDKFVDSLPKWDDAAGEKPVSVLSEKGA